MWLPGTVIESPCEACPTFGGQTSHSLTPFKLQPKDLLHYPGFAFGIPTKKPNYGIAARDSFLFGFDPLDGIHCRVIGSTRFVQRFDQLSQSGNLQTQ